MADAIGAQLFDTALGSCGVAWSQVGLRAVVLAQRSARCAAERLRRRSGVARVAGTGQVTTAPAAIGRLIARVQRQLRGDGDGGDDYRDQPLDLEGLCSPFAQRVYAALRSVSAGGTITYGELARRAGASSSAARAIGRTMAANPLPLVVPCHRVVARDGPGRFSAPGGLQTKLRLLTIEGADLAPFWRAGERELRQRDARLGPVVARAGQCSLRPRAPHEYFDVLAASIVHQQVSMNAGRAIFSRLAGRFGTAAGSLSAEALGVARTAALRHVGLSRQKAGYLIDLARQVADSALPLERLGRMDDERVIELLTRVRGVGRWTAEMFLIFCLARPDVLPVADFGLQQALRRVYRLRDCRPGRVRRLARQRGWLTYRSVATWYLWRALDADGLA